MTPRYNNDEFIPYVQCAAEIICCADMSVPPQRCLPSTSNATCHGIE